MTGRPSLVVRVGLTAAVAVAFLCVTMANSRAQDTSGRSSSLTFSPASGPAGTTIEVQGTCFFATGTPGSEAFIRLARNVGTSGGAPFETSTHIPVQPDGSFSGQLVVPLDAPPADYFLNLACLTGDQDFSDQSKHFTVTNGTPITTSTTAAPTSSTTSTTMLPVAPPATLQVRQPTFTG